MHDAELLASGIAGDVLRPGEAGYDEARAIWNARFDRRPAVVVRPRTTGDVRAAVDFVRARRLQLGVKGGGHAFAAHAVPEGGLLIDLSLMRSVVVDGAGRKARVEAGATWADVDRATQQWGLATPGGTVSQVGVAGFTLGGGLGSLSRLHGMAIDNLLAVELVTAEGDVVRAAADENRELFWAVRGGGGNFGVATSFEFRLHEVGPEVLTGQIFHRFEDAPQVLRAYREFMAVAPRAVQCYPFFLRVPPLEMFPAELHGELVLDLVLFHARTGPAAEAAVTPLVETGAPFLSLVAPQPYTVVQQSFDAGVPKGARYESRARSLSSISDAAIDTMMAELGGMRGDLTSVYLAAGGGAIAEVDPAATAFPHRTAPFNLHVMAGWTDPAQDREVMAWVLRFHEAMAAHATGGIYVNILGTGEENRVRAAYGPSYQRLVELKRRWDPENLFRANHNINPA